MAEVYKIVKGEAPPTMKIFFLEKTLTILEVFKWMLMKTKIQWDAT